jgi:PilZ domain
MPRGPGTEGTRGGQVFQAEETKGMHTTGDRREFSRVPKKLHVKVMAGDTTIDSGNTRDLSLKGLFLLTDRPLPVGTVCQLVLQLESSDSRVFMPAWGRVVRTEPAGMALEFTELGPECYHHLRNLIAADPATVEQELGEHPEFKPPD